MKSWSPIGRASYIALVAACSFFLAFQLGQQTPWYKQYLYHRLLAGNENQRLRAASRLVQVGGQKQLLEALRVDEPGPREVAKKAIEYLWFNSAGPEAFRLVQTAYAASEKEDLPEALKVLDRVVKEFPNFAEGWNQRAAVLWRMGEYQKSIENSEHALALNPNHYGALQGIGVCKIKLGNIPDACRSLRAALKILPHDQPTRDTLQKCEELLKKVPATPKRRAVNLI